ncbi:hypothetical protein [Phaeobacter sp. 11ANDIMAR09]|uniref:hypothetical protein n=1 Tax=Phaeobacter sp. 11ANDIMAR09 TaxID=1225647 RepID=UPI0006C880D1|nr:hypothetical protein [Phaeobacter sp. 11ANDIMAR09]KPD10515.1 hypothetical protein AN476_20645 [Phaeobacter sp. 11ANDIMAR09]
MSFYQWFKLFRLYQNAKWAAVFKALLIALGARVHMKPATQGKADHPTQDPAQNSGHRQFIVTLRNAIYAYEWGPHDFPVRACCEDHAIRLAMDAARDHCQVVKVVEGAQ